MPDSDASSSANSTIQSAPTKKPASGKIGCALFALLMIGGMIALVIPAIKAARNADLSRTCQAYMKRLGLALQHYDDRYGQFPPAYTVDKEGNKLHSWRTLILPFLELQNFYDQLRLEEPWNSPHNLSIFKKNDPVSDESRLLDPSPFYRSPKCPSSIDKDYTNYAMIIGPGCPSDGPNGWRLKELANGSSYSIMLVETKSPIRWYEPKDIDVSTLYGEPFASDPVIGSFHRGVFLTAFCDGSVHPVSESIKKDTLRALIEGRIKNEKAKGSLYNEAAEEQ